MRVEEGQQRSPQVHSGGSQVILKQRKVRSFAAWLEAQRQRTNKYAFFCFEGSCCDKVHQRCRERGGEIIASCPRGILHTCGQLGFWQQKVAAKSLSKNMGLAMDSVFQLPLTCKLTSGLVSEQFLQWVLGLYKQRKKIFSP